MLLCVAGVRRPASEGRAAEPVARDLVYVPGEVLQIDSQLLAFLVEMAAFEAQGPVGLGDVTAVAFELREHDGALIGEHALGEALVLRASTCWTGIGGRTNGRQRQAHVFGGDFAVGEE